MIQQDIIGKNIRKYRKLANMTQGELAEKIKVTTQAVSKWECGGTPDALILYDVAQVLGVSIDALYGLDEEIKSDPLKSLCIQIASMDENKRMEKVLLCALTMAFYATGNGRISELLSDFRGFDEEESEYHLFNIVIENGFSNGDTLKNDSFLFLCFNDENHYDSQIADGDAYRRIFALLGRENVMKVVLNLLHQPQDFFITSAAIASQLSLSDEEVERIMNLLNEEGLVSFRKVMTEDGEMTVWNLIQASQILSFLMIVRDLVEKKKYFTNLDFMPEDYRFLLK